MNKDEVPLREYREKLKELLASTTPEADALRLFGLAGPKAQKVLKSRAFIASKPHT